MIIPKIAARFILKFIAIFYQNIFAVTELSENEVVIGAGVFVIAIIVAEQQ